MEAELRFNVCCFLIPSVCPLAMQTLGQYIWCFDRSERNISTPGCDDKSSLSTRLDLSSWQHTSRCVSKDDYRELTKEGRLALTVGSTNPWAKELDLIKWEGKLSTSIQHPLLPACVWNATRGRTLLFPTPLSPPHDRLYPFLNCEPE